MVRQFHSVVENSYNLDHVAMRGPVHDEMPPATALAREAIDCWLRQQRRKERHDQIAAYAAEMAGTRFDLDPDLEAAGIEHLVKTVKTTK